MAVVFNGEKQYEGAVLKIDEHYWMDGMLEEWAVCWDREAKTIKRITFGYYGCDGSNLAGGTAKVDATKETWREVLRSFRPEAYDAFARSVAEYKRGIRKGTHAKVVRGKKVPKGTLLDVFWVGEKPTYRSMQFGWMNETETVAGCYDEAGNKVWIKTEYLQSIDNIKSPNAKERRKFIKDYVNNKAHAYGAPWVD